MNHPAVEDDCGCFICDNVSKNGPAKAKPVFSRKLLACGDLVFRGLFK
jgi:hypothetical protein